MWYNYQVCSGIEVGTFASAAGGGRSEQKGVAAVKISPRQREEILGTATGHNGAAPSVGQKQSQQCAQALYICSGIEVVITGLTRNQFGSNPTRVRIPPAAPKNRDTTFVVSLFFVIGMVNGAHYHRRGGRLCPPVGLPLFYKGRWHGEAVTEGINCTAPGVIPSVSAARCQLPLQVRGAYSVFPHASLYRAAG